jgi:hypothetical protein
MVVGLLVCKGKMDIDRLIRSEWKEKSSQGRGRVETKKNKKMKKTNST